MKKQTLLHKAGFNKEVGNKLGNTIKKIFKACFIMFGVRGIFTLIYVLGSTRIQTDLGMSVLGTFLGWDNFNNKYLDGPIALGSEEIELKDIKELPIGQEVTLEPQSHNVTYYRIPQVGSVTSDLELHVKGKVWWHYEEYINGDGPLDVKYVYSINKIYRGGPKNDTEKCYLLRWWPRSNFRYDGKELLEGENPNNCELIILNHLDWESETEGYFAFVTPSDDINNGKVSAEYRQFDWNRNE